jgi:flagellar basal-body rod protein FlgG
MAEIITYSAAAGMQAAMMNIANRASNLGNVNSTGYQAIETETKDTFYTLVERAGVRQAEGVGEKPIGVQIGTGVKVTGTYRNLEQGTIKRSSDPLHLSIIGSGYFAVNFPNNQRAYTRAGSFQINSNRQVVTSEGYTLVDDIVIPAEIQLTSVKINNNGLVTGRTNNNPTQEVEIGQINVYGFANEKGLTSFGNSYLSETESSGEGVANTPGDLGFGKIDQYSLELSNVKIANEYAEFMSAQQAYEMSSRMLRAIDEMIKELNK